MPNYKKIKARANFKNYVETFNEKNKYYKILLYHGVSNYSNYKGIENFSKKHISKSVFLKQMKYLKKHVI